MAAPPGCGPLESALRSDLSERQNSETPAPTFSQLVMQAHRSGVAHQMGITNRKLRQLINNFLITRDVNEEFLGWLIEYRDPTGETAVWNVMKERGW